jgi:hypothetical protein
MPAQGGKGGRPMPTQGGKGGGYPQQPGMNPYGGYPQRDFGYGNQLPPQGGKGGTNDALSGSNYIPRSGSIPPQGGKTPLTPEQLDALGPYINNRPPPPGVTTTQVPVQQPAPVQEPLNTAGVGLTPIQQPALVQQPAPVEKPYVDRYAGTIYAGTAGPGAPPPQQPRFDPKMMYYMEMQQRQQMEQQRRQQEAMMRLPPRLRQRYMQQMNQGQQPSNLGLGGLGGLFRGMM